MLRIICIGVALSTVLLMSFKNEYKNERQKDTKRIDTLFSLDINGCKQKILIQSKNIDNPILLYLHGGPGSSFMMYSYLYSNKLIDNFTFVNWDNRGTALSYYEGMNTSKISEDQIRDDAVVLIKYLLKTFHKQKIYLIGHSFGSVIGLQLTANNPELIQTYIGVGQVINWNKSVDITYRWLHDILLKTKDSIGLQRIEENKFPYIDLVVKYGGHHRLSINLDSIIKGSPYYFDGYLSLLQKGKEFSQLYVSKNAKPKGTLAKSIYSIDVPLYFFEGVNDHVIACAPELVVEYCKNVKAPKAEVVWFNNSAHYICIEEPEKFQDELIRILQKTN